MKRLALYLGIAAVLVASCSIQEENYEIPQQDDDIFYASFEQPSEGTRVYANEDLLLRWTADDCVSIFNKNTYNQQYKFTGETGDNAGGFRKVDTDEFVTGNAISNIVSVYPYQEATKITESGTLTLTLPAEQHYAENTFGLGANTMVSVSEDNFLQYKNVGGYLRISLYGDGVSVSSITLMGNNGEKLAGKASLTMPLDGTPTAVLTDDATEKITLVCSSPVALGTTAEGSTDFWFVVPPITFNKGFVVSISLATGETFEKATSKSITIERSNLSKMSPMEVGGTPALPVPEAIDLGLPSGLKWASFNLGASKPEEYGDYYAWGETVPKTNYSWATYKWCNGSSNTLTKYTTQSSYGTVDNKTTLDLEDDAATTQFGEEWRMPTHNEFQELNTLCSWKYTTRSGNKGYLVTGPNGNSIFLPTGGNSVGYVGSYGCYWGADLGTTTDQYGCNFDFTSSFTDLDDDLRYLGRCIRAVKGPKTSDAVNLSAKGTANCYVVSSSGRYMFNASVKGNSSETVGIAVSAEVLWESFNTESSPSVGDIVRDVVFSDGNVYFSATGTDGNALIAVKDSEGTILWSWHIWLCQGFDIEKSSQEYKNQAGIMMDRNIGALSSVPGNPLALGLLFQWGRKDPFMGACQISYSGYSNQQVAASTISWPQAEPSSSTIGTLSFANSHPTTYITQNHSDYDWQFNQTETLWTDDSKSMYDPCPEGYRVPKGGPNGMWEIAGYTSSWDQITRTMTINIVENGGVAYYPACGFLTREEGKLNYAGENGLVWSATMNGNFAYYMDYYLGSSSVGTFNAYRADARPVRCCRISNE